jgi:hypothetical protein
MLTSIVFIQCFDSIIQVVAECDNRILTGRDGAQKIDDKIPLIFPSPSVQPQAGSKAGDPGATTGERLRESENFYKPTADG